MNQRDTSSGGCRAKKVGGRAPSDVQNGDSKDDHADDWLDQRLYHLRDSLELLYCTFGHDKRDKRVKASSKKDNWLVDSFFRGAAVSIWICCEGNPKKNDPKPCKLTSPKIHSGLYSS
jgi:hypothetical protein